MSSISLYIVTLLLVDNQLIFSIHISGLDGPAHAFFAHHRLGFDRSEVGPIPSKVFSNFTEVVSEVSAPFYQKLQY